MHNRNITHTVHILILLLDEYTSLTFPFFIGIIPPVDCFARRDFVLLVLLLLAFIKLPHANVFTTILISNKMNECE